MMCTEFNLTAPASTQLRRATMLVLAGLALVWCIRSSCLAQDDAGGATQPTKLTVIGENDQLVLVGTPDSRLHVQPGREGPLTDSQIMEAITISGVPENPYKSKRELPRIVFPQEVPQEMAKMAKALTLGGSAASGAAAAQMIDLAPPKWEQAATQPVTDIAARKSDPAGDTSVTPDVLTPDITGLVKVQAKREQNVLSPFNPARIIFSNPQRIEVTVQAIIIPQGGPDAKAYALVGGQRVTAGDTFQQTLQVSEVRRDGVIIRLASGVKVFAPVGRKIFIVTEQ